jgi:hypothetical protein
MLEPALGFEILIFDLVMGVDRPSDYIPNSAPFEIIYTISISTSFAGKEIPQSARYLECLPQPVSFRLPSVLTRVLRGIPRSTASFT